MPVKYELLWYMVNLGESDNVRFGVAIRGVKFGADDVQPQGINMSAPIADVGDGSGKFSADEIVQWVKDNKNQTITKAKKKATP